MNSESTTTPEVLASNAPKPARRPNRGERRALASLFRKEMRKRTRDVVRSKFSKSSVAALSKMLPVTDAEVPSREGSQ